MIPVDKKLVHKSREENVFVSNLRRKLPKRIKKAIFEDVILKDLGEKNKEKFKREFVERNLNFIFGCDAVASFNKHIFLSHYIKTKKKFEAIYDDQVYHAIKEKETKFLYTYYKPIAADFYGFSEAPYKIKENTFKSIINSLNQEDTELLHRSYSLDTKENSYILADTISEIEEKKIINFINDQNLHINDYDRAHLSDILDCFQELEREFEFFANIIINTKHSFFFEHPNEHVPGMLIIEGVRQFLLACSHKYGNIPLTGVTIVLQNLDAQFTEYFELYSPILIRSIGNKIKYNKRGYWSLYDTQVEMFQENRLKGTLNVRAISVINKLFKRYRQGSSSIDIKSRFIPRHVLSIPIILYAEGKQVICKVKDISCQGLCLFFPSRVEVKEKAKYDFYTCIDNIGIIHGQCQCVRKGYNEESDEELGGFQITEISKENQQNLIEVIKRYCIINENRDIFEKNKLYNLHHKYPKDVIT